MKDHKLAKQAFVEFRKYMAEMVDEQKRNGDAKERADGGNLLENFVNAV